MSLSLLLLLIDTCIFIERRSEILMEEESMKSIAVYLRVSSKEQAMFGFGLDAQHEKIFKYLEVYDIPSENVKIYKDDGYSAKNLNRPQLKLMLNEVRQKRVKMVIVYKLDRLSRSVVDTYNLLKLFQDVECQLIAIMDHLDIGTANGRMFVGMLSIIAQWEREVISERTMDGLYAKTVQGKYPCAHTPFGWIKDQDHYLHIHDQQAEWIRENALLLIDGATLESCCENFKTVFNKTISPNYLGEIFKSVRLMGKLPYRGQVLDGIVPPILSEEVFHQLQDALKLRKPKNIYNQNFFFRHKVFCSDCGSRLLQATTQKHSKTYYYYTCPVCKKRVNQSVLIEQVIDPILEKMKELCDGESLKRRQKRELTLKTRYNNLVLAYMNGEMQVENFIKASEPLQTLIKEIELEKELQNMPIETLIKGDSKSRYNVFQTIVRKIVVDLTTKKIVTLVLNEKK